MAEYQKLYARHEGSDGQYYLKSYWTSSQTVEFENGQNLEQVNTAINDKIQTKADKLGYSPEDGEISLYSGDTKINTEEMEIRVRPDISLDDVTNFSIRVSGERVRILWTDPDDVIFSNLPLVEWDGTKIVRKVGSAPTSVEDGTVVLDSKVHNAYSTTSYYDDTIQDDTYYYYRLFPYDKEGNYYGKTCGVVYKEISLVTVDIPYQDGEYTYTGNNITPSFVNYDSTAMTKSGATYAKNAGTYTTTFTLKQGYKWSDGTTQPKDIEWSIGKADGFIQLNSYDVILKEGDVYIDINSVSGEITSVTSSNNSVATCSVVNNQLFVQYVSIGTSVITINIAASNNYNSCVQTINIHSEKVERLNYLTNKLDSSRKSQWMCQQNDQSWIKVNAGPAGACCYVVIHKGEIHAFTSDSVGVHYVYRNENWIQLASTPGNMESGFNHVVSYNDSIYYITNNKMYKYNELSNSWVQENQVLPYTSALNVIEYNGYLYIFGFYNNRKNVIRYNDVEKTWEELDNMPDPLTQWVAVVVYNGEVHFVGAYNKNTHMKYDGSEYVVIGTIPYSNTNTTYYNVIVFNGCIHSFGPNYYSDHYIYDGSLWIKKSNELPNALGAERHNFFVY